MSHKSALDQLLAEWKWRMSQYGDARWGLAERYRPCDTTGCMAMIERSQARERCFYHGGLTDALLLRPTRGL